MPRHLNPMSTNRGEARPHAPFYQPVGKEVDVFKAARACQLPVLLKGPTGCGKSRFVEAMAYEVDAPFIQVACNEDTSATDLLGRYLLKGGETLWQDGPVTRAVREGAVLYLDEIAEAREDVVVLLHSLTDHRRQLYLDKTQETLTANASFQVIVSFNPGYQTHFRGLKPSTRQRFVSIEFSYPPKDIELLILERETQADTKTCLALVDLGTRIRNMKDIQLKETASTRLLVHSAKLIGSGLPPRLACDVGIVGALSDDAAISEALRDLISLHF
jgi:nitric oxide reductase NorQ protein